VGQLDRRIRRLETTVSPPREEDDAEWIQFALEGFAREFGVAVCGLNDLAARHLTESERLEFRRTQTSETPIVTGLFLKGIERAKSSLARNVIRGGPRAVCNMRSG
jgi:hypothetical protein